MELENKPLPAKIKIAISVTTLFLVLIGFNQCVLKNTSNGKKSTSTYGSTSVPAPETKDAGDIASDKDLPAGVDMPPMNSAGNDSVATVDVGIKNFEQINMTMSSLTGIATTDTNVTAVYNDIVIQLPTDNNVKNFLPSMQVAIIKLATEYCDRLVENGAKKATIWPTINFGQTPTQTLTPTNKTALINQTVSYFLGPITSEQEAQAKTELMTLYNDLMVGESTTTNLTTRKVVKGLCTAALGSAYVTLL